jgi:hypothetical protein
MALTKQEEAYCEKICSVVSNNVHLMLLSKALFEQEKLTLKRCFGVEFSELFEKEVK